MKSRPEHEPRGIRDIAEALGVSIGTVDRALHDRKGVSAKTRARVLKMAEKLSYSPNQAARNLKLGRTIRIGVYLPREIASYFDPLKAGIRLAASSELGASIAVSFFEYPTLGQGDVELMCETNWDQFDGIIVAPGNPARLAEVSAHAEERNCSIVCVTTDAARVKKLATVTADSFVSGSMAAELLGSWISHSGEVALFTGNLLVQDHADKLRGFAATLASQTHHLTLLPAIEANDSYEDAYTAAQYVLGHQERLVGVYVNTANSLPVLKAIEESGRGHAIKTIVTDFIPEMIVPIETGQITASLYQRPFTQGKLAMEALAGFLARGIQPKLHTRLAPHLIIRSNLSLFTSR